MHRDAKVASITSIKKSRLINCRQNFPHLTFFQGEMRRRLWSFIRQVDVLFSFAVGLPSMIRSSDTDTEIPMNLKDEDFDEDTQIVPMSRPNTEFTVVSYLIAKSDLAFVFGRIAETTSGVQPASYEEIMKLDNEIRDAYLTLSPHLHMKPIEESQFDPASLLTMRMNISLLYNKALCVLHRRFLARSRESSRYSHSRQTCIDTSMTLLRNQSILHAESQPGKRMCRSQYQISSIMTHDFILAAFLIALDLFLSVSAEATGRSSGDLELWGHDRKEEMISALENARAIWNELKDRYLEAFKAFSISGVMLQKIQEIRAQTAARMAQGAFQYAAQTQDKTGMSFQGQGQGRVGGEEEKPEQAAAITLGLLSSAGANGQASASGTGDGGTGWKPEAYPLTPQSQGNSGATGSTGATSTTTGLTPNTNFGIDATMGGIANAPSPFSFFGGGDGGDMAANLDWVSSRPWLFTNFLLIFLCLATTNMRHPKNAWDQYIQNPNIEAMMGGDFWSGNSGGAVNGGLGDFSIPGMEMNGMSGISGAGANSNSNGNAASAQNGQDGQSQQQQQQQQQDGASGNNGGNGEGLQLNSNLFANNPALLPPGTTL